MDSGDDEHELMVADATPVHSVGTPVHTAEEEAGGARRQRCRPRRRKTVAATVHTAEEQGAGRRGNRLQRWKKKSAAMGLIITVDFYDQGSKPLPAIRSESCRITQFAPQTYVINNNNRLGFRDSNSKSFRYYSENRGGKVLASMESRRYIDGRKDDCRPVMPALPSHDRRHLKPPSSHQNSSAKLLALRLAFYMNSWLGTTATTSIFIAAPITDWLDGYLARRLMVAAMLVLLCTRPPEAAMFGQLPWLLTVPSIAIIGRERYPRPHWVQTNPRQFWAESRLLKHAARGRSPRLAISALDNSTAVKDPYVQSYGRQRFSGRLEHMASRSIWCVRKQVRPKGRNWKGERSTEPHQSGKQNFNHRLQVPGVLEVAEAQQFNRGGVLPTVALASTVVVWVWKQLDCDTLRVVQVQFMAYEPSFRLLFLADRVGQQLKFEYCVSWLTVTKGDIPSKSTYDQPNPQNHLAGVTAVASVTTFTATAFTATVAIRTVAIVNGNVDAATLPPFPTFPGTGTANTSCHVATIAARTTVASLGTVAIFITGATVNTLVASSVTTNKTFFTTTTSSTSSNFEKTRENGSPTQRHSSVYQKTRNCDGGTGRDGGKGGKGGHGGNMTGCIGCARAGKDGEGGKGGSIDVTVHDRDCPYRDGGSKGRGGKGGDGGNGGHTRWFCGLGIDLTRSHGNSLVSPDPKLFVPTPKESGCASDGSGEKTKTAIGFRYVNQDPLGFGFRFRVDFGRIWITTLAFFNDASSNNGFKKSSICLHFRNYYKENNKQSTTRLWHNGYGLWRKWLVNPSIPDNDVGRNVEEMALKFLEAQDWGYQTRPDIWREDDLEGYN
ncbi:hypothetical protein OSB04_008598 [Centaurea solstitialis]|uniref:Uncharacterized protein n=1 Tax=Centaurea solstitialis TaxID=347529 RepID=A0AA38U6N0_9ASTR|nr:hypothetical protein OSB04_008598 [Centaurea solstitialis]